MTVLVTGATGLLGNNIVRLLLHEGQAVRVLRRESADRRSLDGLDVEIVTGDICAEADVRRACSGASAVVHSAADVRVGRTGIERQRTVNVVGTAHVAQAARENDARMVQISTVDTLSAAAAARAVDEETPVVAKSDCGYVVTKAEAEAVIQSEVANGLHASLVNPGFMLGPWDWKPSSGRMLLRIATGGTPFAPKGGMSLCDVRDVAKGVVSALVEGQPGRRYIMAGHNITYFDAWRLFASVTGARGPICRAGPFMRIIAGRWGDLMARATGREGDVNSSAVKMSNLYHYYRSDRAEAELGYANRGARETVEAAWGWFQSHGFA